MIVENVSNRAFSAHSDPGIYSPTHPNLTFMAKWSGSCLPHGNNKIRWQELNKLIKSFNGMQFYLKSHESRNYSQILIPDYLITEKRCRQVGHCHLRAAKLLITACIVGRTSQVNHTSCSMSLLSSELFQTATINCNYKMLVEKCLDICTG